MKYLNQAVREWLVIAPKQILWHLKQAGKAILSLLLSICSAIGLVALLILMLPYIPIRASSLKKWAKSQGK